MDATSGRSCSLSLQTSRIRRGGWCQSRKHVRGHKRADLTTLRLPPTPDIMCFTCLSPSSNVWSGGSFSISVNQLCISIFEFFGWKCASLGIGLCILC